MASEHPSHAEFDTKRSETDTERDTDLESDTTIGDDREEEVMQEAILAVLACKERKGQPYHTGLRGRDYVRDLLDCSNPRRHFDVLRMSLTTFQALVYWLVVNTELKSSRKQTGPQIEEKAIQ
jgi:hypothetical protein